ncbi:hypothetical protein [Amycolatopsis panacis]|uniref:Uncharacterized protein n=1 Tax=Amycolatopsis panacis TaxID=2340917 RepID=A0A419IC00_9PSEU|nr:hypothetical protein [Amycolatopsis panacis]RJQ92381.1 hypothetical protein D5S19_01050 [Amycolatopsis panacis]
MSIFDRFRRSRRAATPAGDSPYLSGEARQQVWTEVAARHEQLLRDSGFLPADARAAAEAFATRHAVIEPAVAQRITDAGWTAMNQAWRARDYVSGNAGFRQAVQEECARAGVAEADFYRANPDLLHMAWPDTVARDGDQPPVFDPAHEGEREREQEREYQEFLGRTAIVENSGAAGIGESHDAGPRLDRVADESADREAADRAAYHEEAEREYWAERRRAADELTDEQARDILAQAAELDQHTSGCQQSVENCATCSAEEHDSAAYFWDSVTAAHDRLAGLTAEPIGEVDVNDAPWRWNTPAVSGVPERAPEPGSWIARNLPASPNPARDSGEIDELFDDDGGWAQHQAELREDRAYITARAGQLGVEQAREIVRQDEDIAGHLAGCNLDVSQCAACSAEERDDGSFWKLEVRAAQERLAGLHTEPEPERWTYLNLPGARAAEGPERDTDFELPARVEVREEEAEFLGQAWNLARQGREFADPDDRARLAEPIEESYLRQDEFAAALSIEEACAILSRAAELDEHAGSCSVPLEDCPTCSAQQHRTAGPSWSALAAAYTRLDGVSAAEIAAAGSTPGAPERAPEPGSWIARNLPAGVPVVLDRDYEPEFLTAEEDEAEQLAYDAGDAGVAPYTGMADAVHHRGRFVAHRPAVADPAGTGTDEVLARIDAVLAEPEPPQLDEELRQCRQAVAEAEDAAHRVAVETEDAARAERCARWNTDDEAGTAVGVTDEQGQA